MCLPKPIGAPSGADFLSESVKHCTGLLIRTVSYRMLWQPLAFMPLSSVVSATSHGRGIHISTVWSLFAWKKTHMKPLHTPRYNHPLNKITAWLPGPILRWVEASALARIAMSCSASVCPLDRCAVVHTCPVKPEPRHVLWAIFNAAVVTSAREIPQCLGQIWSVCGWAGAGRCVGVVWVTKRHLRAEKDGRIRTENESSVALGGMILINDSPRSARLVFFSLLPAQPLAPIQWNTSRRCRPSLKVRVPPGALFRGTPPPPRLRGLLSLYPLRWKSPAASLWRCARCHGNSVLQTQKTGSGDVETFVLFSFAMSQGQLSITTSGLTHFDWRPNVRYFFSFLLSPVRYFEVVSSTRKNSVFLRAKDLAMAQSWYNAIQASIANLLPRTKEEMKVMQPGMEVKHLGWITEQVCKRLGRSWIVPSWWRDAVIYVVDSFGERVAVICRPSIM